MVINNEIYEVSKFVKNHPGEGIRGTHLRFVVFVVVMCYVAFRLLCFGSIPILEFFSHRTLRRCI
jgi:hypothetical protein